MTMNTKEITKQALDFQKGVFDSWYGAMSDLQDQAAAAVGTMLKLGSGSRSPSYIKLGKHLQKRARPL